MRSSSYKGHVLRSGQVYWAVSIVHGPFGHVTQCISQ